MQLVVWVGFGLVLGFFSSAIGWVFRAPRWMLDMLGK